MLRHLLAFLTLASILATGTSVLAQPTARDLIRQGMEQRGIYSGVDYQGSERLVDYHEDGGEIHISQGFATGGGEGVYLAVVRNTTPEAYCIRLNARITPADAVTGMLPGNALVESGQHLVVAAASGTAIDTKITIAFWPPDRTAPRICSDVEPAGLEEWVNAPTSQDFRLSFF